MTDFTRSQKCRQLLRNGSCGRLVKAAGAAFDSPRLDAGDLHGTHDGQRGQTGTRKIGDRHVARLRCIFGAGDHRHPDQTEGCKLAIGNDQRRATFFGETISVGDRHHNDVEGVEAVLSSVCGRVGGTPAQGALLPARLTRRLSRPGVSRSKNL